MNPILLKSGGQRESDGAYLCSVFVLGKHLATEDYGALGNRTQNLLDLVVDALHKLPTTAVILEGAGSCTELNLMDRDVVNIPLVRRLHCPWLLVANIDPGGVFAQIVGTKACLSAEDWDLCAGVVVNKLRGEAKYFDPGPRILQEMVGKPIFVVPYLYDLNIAEEDGMGLERRLRHEQSIKEDNDDNKSAANQKTRVVVICYPHISMTDDLLPIEQDDRFQLEWRRQCLPRQKPHAIILPGSRQTRTDMEWLAQSPWKDYILDFVSDGGGGKVLGLCGGFQMLGQQIVDSQGIESGMSGTTSGLGLLPATTTLEASKVVEGVQTAVLVPRDEISVQGFEIHSGQTIVHDPHGGSPLLRRPNQTTDGWISADSVAGTYFHGILASREFRTWFFLDSMDNGIKEKNTWMDPLDRLALHLIDHGLDFAMLSEMMHLNEKQAR